MTYDHKKRDFTVLWEGPCAYVVRTRYCYEIEDCYEIMVFSSNCVTHQSAGITYDGEKAESICRRLNAYPRKTRSSYGLL